MILAAGRGERMRPLTDTCPKPMLLAGGKPLIAWHLEALSAAGFKDVVINHAHLGELIERGLGDGGDYGVHITYSPEVTALETAGGIRKALAMLGNLLTLDQANSDESPQLGNPFLVLNGDVFCDWPLNLAAQKIAEWSDLEYSPQAKPRPLAHLVLVPNPEHNPKGDFYLLANGNVQGDAKPAIPQTQPAHLPGNQSDTDSLPPVAYTFSGIGIYQPELFHDLPLNEPAKLAPLLRQAMAQGRVTGELYSGLWLDIGTPTRLNDLNEYLNKIVDTKEIPKESPAS